MRSSCCFFVLRFTRADQGRTTNSLNTLRVLEQSCVLNLAMLATVLGAPFKFLASSARAAVVNIGDVALKLKWTWPTFFRFRCVPSAWTQTVISAMQGLRSRDPRPHSYGGVHDMMGTGRSVGSNHMDFPWVSCHGHGGHQTKVKNADCNKTAETRFCQEQN